MTGNYNARQVLTGQSPEPELKGVNVNSDGDDWLDEAVMVLQE